MYKLRYLKHFRAWRITACLTQFLYLYLLTSIWNSQRLLGSLVSPPSWSTGTRWAPGGRGWRPALSRTRALSGRLLLGSLGGNPITCRCVLARAAARKLNFNTEGVLSRSKIFLTLCLLDFQTCGSENLSLKITLWGLVSWTRQCVLIALIYSAFETRKIYCFKSKKHSDK